ncbi:MAG: DUF4279 domain-containing protein [Steroidobacter sp.]|nr:DUF4279 domain-containing protein [Steroidobacter sp.]
MGFQMATINRTLATLRISGEDLDPEEVSTLLGHPAERSQKKGEEIIGRSTGEVRIARFGIWVLKAPEAQPGDIDGQLNSILEKLTDDLSVWKQLSARFEMDLFCGLFMEGGMEGLCISPESLLRLGERGIELGLDIYAGDGELARDANAG